MSTEKYAGLPDIDTAADVYEDNEIAFENNDPYDSDDSLLRLQHQSSISNRQKSDQAKDAGANGGIDEGHLPNREEVGRKFRRGKSVGLGVISSAYTYRPHSHPFSSSLFASAPSSGSSSSSDSDHHSDEDFNGHLAKPDLNIDQLGPAPLPSGKVVNLSLFNAQRTKQVGQPQFREEPSSRLRRLKREMMEVERQVEAQARAQEQALTSSTQPAQLPSGTSHHRKKPKPDAKTMMGQLLQLKSGLNTLEDRADDLVLSGVKVDENRRRAREEEGQGLLKKLEVEIGGIGSTDLQPDQRAGVVKGKAAATDGAGAVDNVSELDRRLNLLERRVGTGSTAAIETVNPILPTLDRLESIVALLSQPNQLDAVSRRIKLLLNDLDKVSAPPAGKAGQPVANKHAERPADETDIILSTTDFEKINALYSLLPRIDPLIPVVPALLTRLRSLSSLHASASSFQATTSRLQTDANKMKETDGEIKEVMDGLTEGMKEQGEVMKGNWDRLGERLKAVEERMTNLQSS